MDLDNYIHSLIKHLSYTSSVAGIVLGDDDIVKNKSNVPFLAVLYSIRATYNKQVNKLINNIFQVVLKYSVTR